MDIFQVRSALGVLVSKWMNELDKCLRFRTVVGHLNKTLSIYETVLG